MLGEGGKPQATVKVAAEMCRKERKEIKHSVPIQRCRRVSSSQCCHCLTLRVCLYICCNNCCLASLKKSQIRLLEFHMKFLLSKAARVTKRIRVRWRKSEGVSERAWKIYGVWHTIKRQQNTKNEHELIMFWGVWKCILGFCGHKESGCERNRLWQRLIAPGGNCVSHKRAEGTTQWSTLYNATNMVIIWNGSDIA